MFSRGIAVVDLYMFSQGLMKGYIARERQIVVLSKKGDAFPGTGV